MRPTLARLSGSAHAFKQLYCTQTPGREVNPHPSIQLLHCSMPILYMFIIKGKGHVSNELDEPLDHTNLLFYTSMKT